MTEESRADRWTREAYELKCFEAIEGCYNVGIPVIRVPSGQVVSNVFVPYIDEFKITEG